VHSHRLDPEATGSTNMTDCSRPFLSRLGREPAAALADVDSCCVLGGVSRHRAPVADVQAAFECCAAIGLSDRMSPPGLGLGPARERERSMRRSAVPRHAVRVADGLLPRSATMWTRRSVGIVALGGRPNDGSKGCRLRGVGVRVKVTSTRQRVPGGRGTV
jgi:hypothetical protein